MLPKPKPKKEEEQEEGQEEEPLIKRNLLLTSYDGLYDLKEVVEDEDTLQAGGVAYPKNIKSYGMVDGRRIYFIEEVPETRIEGEELKKLKDTTLFNSLFAEPASEQESGLKSQLPMTIIAGLAILASIFS